MRRSLLVAAVLGLLTACTPSGPPAPPVEPSAPAALATLATLATSAPATSAPSRSAPSTRTTPTGPLIVPNVSSTRLLQAADGGEDPFGYGVMPPDHVAAVLRPPCASAAGPSEALLDLRVSATMSYRFSGSDAGYDGTVDEVLTRYRVDGAARLLAEWKAAVAACPHLDLDPVAADHAIVASGFAGPESVLVTTTRSGPTSRDDPQRFSSTEYTALIRLGDATIVVRVGPWETGSPRRDDVDRLIGAALARATA
jgi:hypothetical protein